MSARLVLVELEGRQRDMIVAAALDCQQKAGEAAAAMTAAMTADRHLADLLEVVTGRDPKGLSVDTTRGVVFAKVPEGEEPPPEDPGPPDQLQERRRRPRGAEAASG